MFLEITIAGQYQNNKFVPFVKPAYKITLNADYIKRIRTVEICGIGHYTEIELSYSGDQLYVAESKKDIDGALGTRFSLCQKETEIIKKAG